jgi:4-nitrophenyl phosphatase
LFGLSSLELQSKFQQFSGFLFDCDGVLWQGSKLLPGTKQLLEFLKISNKEVGFVSNNSTLSIESYIKKFLKFNLSVQANQIITSTQATIHYLNSLKSKIKEVYVIGEAGLINSLSSEGYNVNLKPNDPTIIDAVVVGMDRQLTYEKLKIGLRAIRSGARFIGSNPDPQYPDMDGGFSPGAGCMIGALARTLRREPERICGKPDPLLAEILLSRLKLKAHKCVMIGDRVSTDLQFAVNSGMAPVLVKTGFGEEDLRKHPDFPYHAILDTLEDLI